MSILMQISESLAGAESFVLFPVDRMAQEDVDDVLDNLLKW
jgi:hypothetical protein